MIAFLVLVGLALGLVYYIIHLHWKLDIAKIDRDYYKTILEIEKDYGKTVEASRDRAMKGWTDTLAWHKEYSTKVNQLLAKQETAHV